LTAAADKKGISAEPQDSSFRVRRRLMCGSLLSNADFAGDVSNKNCLLAFLLAPRFSTLEIVD
jgi:hypothetical protein